MPEHPDADFEEVARHFTPLWRALTASDQGPHAPERRRFLIDQVRDALDRGEERLDDRDRTIIANTFTLETLVHEGAATRIYRARHRDLGTLHAIKMLRPGRAGDPVTQKLLLREAKIGMAIRHPNVAATETVLRLGDGRPAIVFEWLAHTLGELSADVRLTAGDIIRIMTALLDGLGAIHAAGFVHGDLAPANLFYEREDFSRLKIADFGIALETGTRHQDLDLAFAGRPEFAPPEQTDGKPLDARSDLYAAGKILSLLLGRCNETNEQTEQLVALAGKLCRKNPEERPENTKAARHLLDGSQTL